MEDLIVAKVLIVEDQTIDAMNTSFSLKSFGIDVVGIAGDAETAIKLAEKYQPDLILMDINLGDSLTGIDVGRNITSKYAIPIVFTSAYSDDDTLSDALSIAPYGYLVKPFGSAMLKTAVKVALERKRIDDEMSDTTLRLHIASNVAKLAVLEIDEITKSIVIKSDQSQFSLPVSLSLDDFMVLFPDDDKNALEQAIGSKKAFQARLKVVDNEHKVSWLQVTLTDLSLTDQGVRIGAIQDVTDLHQIESELLISDRIVQEMQEGVLVFDSDGVITKANSAAGHLIGVSSSSLIGKLFFDYFPRERDSDETGVLLKDGMREEMNIITEEGTRKHIVVSVNAIEHQQHRCLVAILTDVTALKSTESKLKYLAFTDPLTGAGNRNYLNHVIQSFQSESSHVSLIFIDLDEFKLINDSYGHEIGDQVLRSCVSRMLVKIRETDKLIRFGGDEFVIVSTDNKPIVLQRFAERLASVFESPFVTSSAEFVITASIGIAVANESTCASDLLKHADIAMYQAKQLGKNNIVFFDDSLTHEIEYRLFVQQGLRTAIASGEICAYFQPIVNTSGNVVALEALARWHVPGRGAIGPDKFIPIAERSYLIHELGLHMLKEGCMALRALDSWGYTAVVVNINISARQLGHEKIIDAFREVITRFALSPARVVLEITESTLQSKPARKALSELKDLGFRISIDDFGTGYSCISELAENIYDAVKIDRSLLPEFPIVSTSGNRQAIIIKNVIEMCKALEVPCTLEGLESLEQVSFATDIGADTMQGYYFAMPMNLLALMEYMQAKHAVPQIVM